MSGYTPLPKNNTVSISASTNNANVYLDVGTANSITNILVTNSDTANVAFINWSLNGSSIATTAGFPVPPGTPTVINVNSPNVFDSNITVSAITAVGTATIYITPVTF